MSTKSPDRRSAILDAVTRLLAESGLAGVTHRATDAAAGLPQGSTTYYFPKKQALLRAAAEHLAVEFEKDCDALQIGFADVAAKRGVDAAVDYVAARLIATLDEAKPLLLARIELTLAASRIDELADVGDRLALAGRRPIEFFVTLIAEGKENVPIETCVGLIDGVALLHAAGQAPQPTADQIATVVRSLIIR